MLAGNEGFEMGSYAVIVELFHNKLCRLFSPRFLLVAPVCLFLGFGFGDLILAGHFEYAPCWVGSVFSVDCLLIVSTPEYDTV